MDSDSPSPLLHIGFYKTASTWLQHVFFVPRNGMFKAFDPLEVHEHLLGPGQFSFDVRATQEAYAAAVREASPEQVPVISSEALSGHILAGGYNAKSNADRLKLCFPHAKVLLTIREQRSLIRSMYYTMVSAGSPYSIKRLMEVDETMLRRGPMFSLDFLQFDPLARYYRELYGAENVLVIPYELFKSEPLAFLGAIYEHVHDSRPPPGLLEENPLGRIINGGVSLTYITWQRLVNRFLVQSPANYTGLTKDSDNRFYNRSLRYQRYPKRTPLDGMLEARFSRIVGKYTHDRFAQGNRTLQEFCEFDLGQFGYEL